MLNTSHKLTQKVIVEYSNVHVFGLVVGEFSNEVVDAMYEVIEHSNRLNMYIYDSFALTSNIFMHMHQIIKDNPFKYTINVFYCDPILNSLIEDLQSSFYPGQIKTQPLSKAMCEKAHEMLDSENPRTIVE